MNAQNEAIPESKNTDSRKEKNQSRLAKLEKVKETYKNGLKWILLGILTGAVVGSIPPSLPMVSYWLPIFE